MANARAVVNEVALLDGATLKDLESHDLGREFIYPFLHTYIKSYSTHLKCRKEIRWHSVAQGYILEFWHNHLSQQIYQKYQC